MNPDHARRFIDEFAPRIVAVVLADVDHGLRGDVEPQDDHQPTRLRFRGEPIELLRRYPHPLNIVLTWDDDEIARLMQPGGEARFVRYLKAVPRKLAAWSDVRPVDLRSRTQGEAAILIGGLDFES